jgi:glycosyltransferase involved in cell wall biosynthesis
MTALDITAIVVTYNRATMLRDTLQSLIRQDTAGTFSYEILVVDDGSTDNTPQVVSEMAREAAPLVVRYLAKQRGGEGDARNVGMREAHGQWVAFCDDDQVADRAWLAELFREALASRADCVGGAVSLSLPSSGSFDLGSKSRQELGEKLLSSPSRLRPVKDAIGAGNCLLRKSLLEAVGNFDVSFRQGVDTDFFWRVEKAGLTMSLAPQALVYHVIPESRLNAFYLRQVCLRKGVATARIIVKHNGYLKLFLLALLRMGIVCSRDLPFVLIAPWLNNAKFHIDCWCGLWFGLGFLRGALFFLSPGLFPQKQFFQQLTLQHHGLTR